MTSGRLKLLAAALLAACPWALHAQPAPAGPADPHPWQLNLVRGVTPTSQAAYDAHMIVLWVCVVIGVLVFGAMAIAIFRFRKSKGAVRDSEMTVKITGYQWMWKYEYRGEDVSFTSRLAQRSNELRQSGGVINASEDPHYLLDVDNMLVLPVDTKVRFLLTADDVIHSWWVPALGFKQDAVPGFVNEAWARIETPGIYRGQCAELCGKDHGFMPIVVKAVSKQEFAAWLAAKKAEHALPAAPAPAAPAPAATPDAAPAEAAPAAAAPAEMGSAPPAPAATPAAPATAG